MKEKLKSLGLVSSIISKALNNGSYTLNYETTKLVEASKKYYKSVQLIDPLQIAIDLVEHIKVKIYYNGEDISGLTTLLVRGTSKIELPTRALANALINCGCDIVDPIDRFSGNKASKLLTTIQRHKKDVGSTSYLVFGKDEAMNVINRACNNISFPMLLKPIYGKHGFGIRKLNNKEEAIKFITEYIGQNQDEALLLQKWINYKKEYRSLVIHGNCIGTVEKVKKEDSIVSNARNAAEFKPVNNRKIEKLVLDSISPEGLLGVDIGVKDDDTFHIIEANRAPEWLQFEKAMEFNIAEVIIEKIYNRTVKLHKENSNYY